MTKNDSDDKGLAQTLNFSGCKHVKTYPEMTVNGTLDIEVPPKGTNVILIKRLDAKATFGLT